MKILAVVYSVLFFLIGYMAVVHVKPDYTPAHFQVDTPKVYALINDSVVDYDEAVYDTISIFDYDYSGGLRYHYSKFHYIGKGVDLQMCDSAYFFKRNTLQWAIANNLIK